MEYFFSRNFGGYIYTIDMIRFKTNVKSYNDYEDIKRYCLSGNFDWWSGHGFGKFINNWKVDSLWIGLDTCINKKQKIDGNIFCLEFNPNKCTERDWQVIYYFLRHFDWEITRFDLAIDIPKNINQIVFQNIRKKSYSVYFVDFENKTYYFGKGNGHTKIYNKKIESSLDYELTRYEVTKEVSLRFNCPIELHLDFGFLEISYTPYELIDDSYNDDTLGAILYAVNCGYPYKSLSRRYKELIKKDFFGCYELNNEYANATFNDFISFLKRYPRI